MLPIVFFRSGLMFELGPSSSISICDDYDDGWFITFP
jgi:hypothetical protein